MSVVENALQEKNNIKTIQFIFEELTLCMYQCKCERELIVSSNAKQRAAHENESRRRAHQSLVLVLCIFYRYDHSLLFSESFRTGPLCV